MTTYRVSRGLDLPIGGKPASTVHEVPPPAMVAVLPSDYRGIRPRLIAQEGDTVRRGDPLYQDRTHEEIVVTAPVAGQITAINRGERRVIQSIVITRAATDAAHTPAAWSPTAWRDRDTLRALLLASGLWPAFRSRPFSRTPAPHAVPDALFVTAIDTQPLAPDMDAVVRGHDAAFRRGLDALRVLIDGPVYCCRPIGSTLGDGVAGITTASFGGKHPAGNVGYHIHTLHPVSRGRSVWHIGVQDVIRIGHLVNTGEYDATQVVSVAGPGVTSPQLVRTELGAHIPSLLADNMAPGVQRVISGSVLTGTAMHAAETAYLGRFHQQITVLPEGGRRTFLGWLRPSTTAFSTLPVYARATQPHMDTQLNGSPRAMVPIGVYERVMPFDLMPTHLLRALAVGDAEWAESLGALELDEEDIALCTVVCPGKYEYGGALRRVLDQIATEV